MHEAVTEHLAINSAAKIEREADQPKSPAKKSGADTQGTWLHPNLMRSRNNVSDQQVICDV
jgi:hypothetical protein